MFGGDLRDWYGRATDYIFGRNTLIGVASLMLLLISGYATWHGMRDFIIGASSSPAKPAAGSMSISNDVLVIGVVVALTFLLWLALRETFGAKRRLSDRLIMLVLYIFLAVWSIGFGYGFWWSLISGEEATRTGLSGLQEDARDASGAVAARLDAVRAQLDSVVSWSESQMAREEASGGSCGTSSGAGRGPLYNARRGVRDSISTLRDGMTKSWLEPVQAEVEQLRKSAASLEGGTVEERQKNFEAKASEIRGAARNIASRSNELGKSTAAEMRALAESVSVPPGQPGFSCYDPTLAQRLKQAAEQSDQPATLTLREAEFNEGPAGVANAVKNLWKNIGAYASSLIGYVVSGGATADGQTKAGEPITGRDLIALLATIGVDLGLLALAILNPPPAASLRPPAEVVRQIRDAIMTAISRADAAGADIEWVRRHFIYHKEASFLVLPNLYSADPGNKEEATKALAMNQLAGVLDDLGVVRWPYQKTWWMPWKKSELQRLKEDEMGGSDSDLTEIRKSWLEKIGSTDGEAESTKDDVIRKSTPLRNHGVFSKAERALTIAGWSEQARRDVEILRVVDTEGLTPILMVLNEPEATAKQDQRGGASAKEASAG
ncbi:MAG: hypothetical protein WC807_06310 [Hyphomicrobium sp.]|jgi:hypothetical protein